MRMRERWMPSVTLRLQMKMVHLENFSMSDTQRTEYLQTMVPIQILKVMEYLMVL